MIRQPRGGRNGRGAHGDADRARPAADPARASAVPRGAGRSRGVVGASVLAAGAVLLTAMPAPAQRPPSDGPSAATPVTVAEVAPSPEIMTLPLTGTVQARRVSRVAAQVAGFVSELRVDVGDAVSAGEVLAVLDRALERSAVAAAEAAVAQGEARLADVVRRRDEARELLERDNVPETQYRTLEAQVLQEQAALARLRAEFDRRRELLDRHVISAPFDGVVAMRLTEQGQWLQSGAPVVELHEIDVLRVRAEVPQAWFGRVEIGTPAELRFDARPDEVITARVDIRVAVADAAARTFPVLLELDNARRSLTPGMSVRVGLQVPGNRAGETLQVPRDALVRGPDGVTRVWVVRETAGGALQAQPVAVRLGRYFGAGVEVLDGELRRSDRVVVRGNETLRAGERVRVLRVTAESG